MASKSAQRGRQHVRAMQYWRQCAAGVPINDVGFYRVRHRGGRTRKRLSLGTRAAVRDTLHPPRFLDSDSDCLVTVARV